MVIVFGVEIPDPVYPLAELLGRQDVMAARVGDSEGVGMTLWRQDGRTWIAPVGTPWPVADRPENVPGWTEVSL